MFPFVGPSPQAQDSPAVTHRSPLNKEKGLREFFVAPLDVEDMKRQKEEARQKALKEGKIAPDTDERDKQRVAELRDDGDFFIYWLMVRMLWIINYIVFISWLTPL